MMIWKVEYNVTIRYGFEGRPDEIRSKSASEYVITGSDTLESVMTAVRAKHPIGEVEVMLLKRVGPVVNRHEWEYKGS